MSLEKYVNFSIILKELINEAQKDSDDLFIPFDIKLIIWNIYKIILLKKLFKGAFFKKCDECNCLRYNNALFKIKASSYQPVEIKFKYICKKGCILTLDCDCTLQIQQDWFPELEDAQIGIHCCGKTTYIKLCWNNIKPLDIYKRQKVL